MLEPSQPLTLSRTHIINIDEHSVKVPVSVMLQMLPNPEVVFESDQLPTLLLRNMEHTKKVKLENGTEIDVLLNSMNSNGNGSLIPSRQPVIALDKGRPIQSLRFSVLNLTLLLWRTRQMGPGRRAYVIGAAYPNGDFSVVNTYHGR